jgi:hypothetical protein
MGFRVYLPLRVIKPWKTLENPGGGKNASTPGSSGHSQEFLGSLRK